MVFCGVRDYPARVKCATLAWHTLKSALDRRRAKPVVHRMSLQDQVIAALQKVFDPEMPVNIYELGLIYDVRRGRRRAGRASA